MNHFALMSALALVLCAASSCGEDSPSRTPPGDPNPDPNPAPEPDPEPEPDQRPQTRVLTTEGPVVGDFDALSQTLSWKGIPYAAPPTGELRWRAPQLPEIRSGDLDAAEHRSICPQPQPGSAGAGLVEDEDCLTLNIWAPADALGQSLPVMFWIHGGSFTSGSGSLGLYDGASLTREGVVVVTINYRLGALGFLTHESFVGEADDYPGAGNYGLLDQIAALQWVRQNIEAFGGDPNRVTAFGESAGAISLCALMASPLAEGLFVKAIMQSGFCALAIANMLEPRGNAPPASEQGDRIVERTGCANDPDVLACMREASVSQLRQASVGDFGQAEAFNPVIDDHVLSTAPGLAIYQGETHAIPLLLGTNADEGTIFLGGASIRTASQFEDAVRRGFDDEVAERILELYPLEDYPSPRRALAAVIGDFFFICPTRFAAKESVRHGRDTWLYHFTHVTDFGANRDLGSFHGSELAFVFGTLGAFLIPSQEEVLLSRRMQALWGSFATDGGPTANGIVWDPYDAAEDESLELSLAPGMIEGVRRVECDFWEEVLGLPEEDE